MSFPLGVKGGHEAPPLQVRIHLFTDTFRQNVAVDDIVVRKRVRSDRRFNGLAIDANHPQTGIRVAVPEYHLLVALFPARHHFPLVSRWQVDLLCTWRAVSWQRIVRAEMLVAALVNHVQVALAASRQWFPCPGLKCSGTKHGTAEERTDCECATDHGRIVTTWFFASFNTCVVFEIPFFKHKMHAIQ